MSDRSQVLLALIATNFNVLDGCSRIRSSNGFRVQGLDRLLNVNCNIVRSLLGAGEGEHNCRAESVMLG